MRLYFFIIILFLGTPFISSADISITEIMYDVEGSDTDTEWVEVYNSGDQTINLPQWHFFENDVHHGLFIDDVGDLAPGEYAIIATNPDVFSQKYYENVMLLKSSFSLNNSGESLGISDPDKNIVFSISYSSEDGASGDGNSLQYISGSWESQSPTPGASYTYSATDSDSSSVNAVTQNTSTSPKNSSSAKKVSISVYKGFIDLGSQQLTHTPFKVKVWVEHIKNNTSTKKLKGWYFINWGDGNTLTTDQRIETEYFYEYPGVYTLVFEYYKSYLAYQNGNEPLVSKVMNVSVINPGVTVTGIDLQSGITLTNSTDTNINLAAWDLGTVGNFYTFPEHSYIGSNTSLVIPRRVHGLQSISDDVWVVLRNDRDYTISSYTNNKTKLARAQNQEEFLFQQEVSTSVYDQEVSQQTEYPSIELVSSENEVDPLEKYLEQFPDKKFVNLGDPTYVWEPESDTGYSSHVSPIPLGVLLVVGVLGSVLIILRIIFKNKSDQEREAIENDQDIGTIELIE